MRRNSGENHLYDMLSKHSLFFTIPGLNYDMCMLCHMCNVVRNKLLTFTLSYSMLLD